MMKDKVQQDIWEDQVIMALTGLIASLSDVPLRDLGEQPLTNLLDKLKKEMVCLAQFGEKPLRPRLFSSKLKTYIKENASKKSPWSQALVRGQLTKKKISLKPFLSWARDSGQGPTLLMMNQLLTDIERLAIRHKQNKR